MKRPRVLIIGAGFAGFHCARQLERKLEAHEAEVALVTPRNYLIYSPLLPQVAYRCAARCAAPLWCPAR